MKVKAHFSIYVKNYSHWSPYGIGIGYHHKWMLGGSTFYIHIGPVVFSITHQ